MRTPRSSLTACAVALLSPLLSTIPAAPAGADGTGPGPDPSPSIGQVVVISLDGLNPTALTRLGTRGTPVLHQMMRRGASTLDARTAYEMTVTLPNHTTMVTGRRIAAADGGHGVTWNDDRLTPPTVQAAAGGPVESVFNVVHDAGRQTALFASKTKFSLWQRSWPMAIDSYRVELDNRLLTNAVRRDVRTTDRAFTFVHLSDIDVVGHARGWMSPAYLQAVRRADTYVGRILSAIEKAGETDETMVVVTADHGGMGTGHSDAAAYADYRIPFLVVGPDVPRRTDLYDLNPDYRAPRAGRPGYDAPRQPIRNGAVADLVTDVLGLPAVTGSQVDAEQDLDVFRTP
ncbi:MAG: alkaline phosphatase family protein [Nocardioides sp.]